MKQLKTILIPICVIFIAQILGGCATSKYGRLTKEAFQYYERGDYDSTVFACARLLRADPKNDEARALIKDAFRVAVNAHEQKINELKSSAAIFEWNNIVIHYEALISLNEEIKNLQITVNGIEEIKIIDYSQDLTKAKTNAAEVHYQEGIRVSQKKDKESKKQAAKEFKTCLSFIPGYKDALEKYEKYKKEGMKKIAVVFFENKEKECKYGTISKMLTDQIMANVMKNPIAMEFLEFVSPEKINKALEEENIHASALANEQTAIEVGRLLEADEIFLGEITQIVYTPPKITIKQLDRQIEVEENKGWSKLFLERIVDSQAPETEKKIVEARIKVYTKTITASIGGSYKIVEIETLKLKQSAPFKGEADYQYQWATYDGDKRALEYQDKELMDKGKERSPSEEELIMQATQNLSVLLTKEVEAYVIR